MCFILLFLVFAFFQFLTPCITRFYEICFCHHFPLLDTSNTTFQVLSFSFCWEFPRLLFFFLFFSRTGGQFTGFGGLRTFFIVCFLLDLLLSPWRSRLHQPDVRSEHFQLDLRSLRTERRLHILTLAVDREKQTFPRTVLPTAYRRIIILHFMHWESLYFVWNGVDIYSTRNLNLYYCLESLHMLQEIWVCTFYGFINLFVWIAGRIVLSN